MGCRTSKPKVTPSSASNASHEMKLVTSNSFHDSQKNNNWFSPKLSNLFNTKKEKQKEITNQKLFKALEKKRHENKNSQISFQRILLKFEKMHAILKDVKAVFMEVSADGEGLNIDGLQEAMTHLHVSMTKDEVADLFGFIDLDGSLKIELKEFLVALTIGMVLDAIPAFAAENLMSGKSINSPASPTLDRKNYEIKEMLNLIVSAYLLFDPEGEGHIKKHNVEKLLEESGHQAGKNAMLSQDKWKEMDWDANGTIDFAEFVMAFSTWVDLNDEMA